MIKVDGTVVFAGSEERVAKQTGEKYMAHDVIVQMGEARPKVFKATPELVREVQAAKVVGQLVTFQAGLDNYDRVILARIVN